MSIRNDAGTLARILLEGRARRSSRRHWDGYQSTVDPVLDNQVEALVYFADSPINLYQARQWYEPIAELAKRHSVVFLARNITTADLLRRECPVPVVWVQRIAEIESWVASQRVGAVFYLNQNSRNFAMMRVREPAHVFLSHGESDKDYMASNQLKAYDYTFVAGSAARDRLRGKLVSYDVDARTIEIGRPQVDVHHEPPGTLTRGDRTVVLYAPTWEGDRPSMSYSSVQSHAPVMIAALVATGRHTVIYRPHPRTGASDAGYRKAHKTIVNLLHHANKMDATAHHLVDVDSKFGWHLDAADACIADISAVAFDWLATGKPVVLTRPVSRAAEIHEDGIAGTLLCVTAESAGDIVALLEAANNPDRLAKREALVHRYFGDVTPGASMGRWLDAAARVINERRTANSD